MAGKTIVISCDGTGNSDTGVASNVKRLHDFLLNDGTTQITKYHQGVGTDGRADGELLPAYWWRSFGELCFGDGIKKTMIELYGWLAETYRPGDRVFMFGFSRGAFTVRAVAGLIHACGLIRPGAPVTAADAVDVYFGSEARIKEARRRHGLRGAFQDGEGDHAAMDPKAVDFAVQHGCLCGIEFLGLWDTVKAYGWVWPRSFPALRHNMSVRTVRHAVALDEGRALFQMTGWASALDVEEVWFAGDHSDVGGGHKSGNSALADASLRWMLGEARAAGLRLDPAAKERVDRVKQNSARAVRERAKGRRERWKFFVLDCLLRFELDNHGYPPTRNLRILWPGGARTPGDHAFGTTVRVHASVETRRSNGDPRYRTARLVRRSRGVRETRQLTVESVEDRDIT